MRIDGETPKLEVMEPNSLNSTGVKCILDLLNGLVAQVGEQDRVGALGDWVALVELASDDSRESHAG